MSWAERGKSASIWGLTASCGEHHVEDSCVITHGEREKERVKDTMSEGKRNEQTSTRGVAKLVA